MIYIINGGRESKNLFYFSYILLFNKNKTLIVDDNL